MPMIEFRVFCSKCGKELHNRNDDIVRTEKYGVILNVDPCINCLKEAKDKGDEEGYERRQDEEEDEVMCR